MLQGNRVIVGRLTAHFSGDCEVAPGSWKQRFGNGDLHPPGLPSASILLLRRMRSRYIADTDEPPYRLPADWEQQVKIELDDQARKALRPVNGVLPAHAEAVLFRDEAELRALLVLDLIKGWARGRWWWRRFLRGLPVAEGDAIVKICTEAPQLLPAIVDQLVRWGEATPFVQRLRAPQLHSLLACLSAAFALPWPMPRERDVEAKGGSEDSIRGSRVADQPDRYANPAEPWSAGVARIAGDDFLPLPERALFMGLALSLYREPARVRTLAFGKALARWWEASEPAPPGSTGAENGQIGDRGKQINAAATEADESAFSKQREVAISRPVENRPSTNARSKTGPSVTPLSPETDREAKRLDARSGSQRPGFTTIAGPSEELWPAVSSAPGATPRQAVESRSPGSSAAFSGVELDTRWGGIFYLVNLMEALGLPGCWEDPWRLGSVLGPWGWLAAVARGVAPPGALISDPAYGVLLELAGCQPGEPLGLGVPEMADYLLPNAWLSSEESAIRVADSDSRLLVWDETGWMLADLARQAGTVEAQIHQLLHQMGRPVEWAAGSIDQAPIGDPLPGLSAGLNRLLQRSLPFLIAELGRRLGDGQDDVLQASFARPAKIQMSSTHIDLLFHLDRVDIATRRAGLDRDPGWLPDYGRVIAFHYS